MKNIDYYVMRFLKCPECGSPIGVEGYTFGGRIMGVSTPKNGMILNCDGKCRQLMMPISEVFSIISKSMKREEALEEWND